MPTGEDANLGQAELARLIEIGQQQRVRDDAEIERRWKSHIEAMDDRWSNHLREHTALANEVDKLAKSQQTSLNVALADHHREHEVHAAAHEKEHGAHNREHELNEQAVTAAAHAVDKRLEGMNEFRQQLRDQATTFASTEKLDALTKSSDQRLAQFQDAIDRRFADTTKHTDERYEENRRRIEALEKGDVKAEGRTLGQGAVIAIIVTAIGIVGTVLAIIVTLANLATGNP